MSRYRISPQKAGRRRPPVVHRVHGPESRAADAFPCVKWYFGMFRIRNIMGEPIESRQKEHPSCGNDGRGSEVAQGTTRIYLSCQSLLFQARFVYT